MGRLVAVSLPPSAALLAAVEQLWAAGDTALLIAPGMPAPRLRALLDQTRPAALLGPAGIQELEDGEPIDGASALVVPTSGSTGPIKAVELSHLALGAAVSASLDRLGATTDDRWLCCLPPAHIAGFLVLMRARQLGTEALIHDRFDPAAVAAEGSATHVALVPTMLRRLLDTDANLRHLRCVLLGGAPAPPTLLDRAAAAGVHVVTTYGMTETAGGCVYDGVPLDGVAVRTTDSGAIQISGPLLFSGYRLAPAETAAVLSGGWLTTADLGRIDAGRLTVLGRSDDVVISGGVNVSAAAVEAALGEHPAVVEAAVVGEADDDWGQRVVAYVVLQREVPPAELLNAVRARLGAAAVPKRLVVVADLPRLDSGKVDAVALRRGATGA